jgi:hypothetical protein
MIWLSIIQPAFTAALPVIHDNPMYDDFWQAQIKANFDE